MYSPQGILAELRGGGKVRRMRCGGKAILVSIHILKVISMCEKTPIMFKVYFYT